MGLCAPVLIAIDIYSEYHRILIQALKIAQQPNFCHLIFVVMPFADLQPYLSKADYAYAEQREKQGRRRLQEIASQFHIPHGNIHTLRGDVSDKICNIANKINAGLIVIGSHGRTGIKPLLGSHANKILQEAKHDVLAIRLNDIDD